MACNNRCIVPAVGRRDFLSFSMIGMGALAGSALPALGQDYKGTQTTPQTPAEPKKETTKAGKKCNTVIRIWLPGAPSQVETFDPKPGRPNGGKAKAIDTAAKGIQISEYMPQTAKAMKHVALLRSMNFKELAHERAALLAQIGMAQSPFSGVADMGTIVAYERGPKDLQLPYSISMGATLQPGQSLPFGGEYAPYRVLNTSNPIPDSRSPVGADRDLQRTALLSEQNKDWDSQRQQGPIGQIEKAYVKAQEVMTTPQVAAFNVGQEDAAIRAMFGNDGFSQNCLVAYRLAKVGVPFIALQTGFWDMHDACITGMEKQVPSVDAGFGGLVNALAASGLLDTTLVMIGGEFGRTPSVNGGQGRDHHEYGSWAMAGGGIRGGIAFGDSGVNGTSNKDQTTVGDVWHTVFSLCGIDPKKSYIVEGRRIAYAYKDVKGAPIRGIML
ncbi:MAG TPA: DUF1501 domain-containing protein [Planctomycetota bacterium]|nr:DUF1501 domain-containing protein [Planctomycetota bacterium]